MPDYMPSNFNSRVQVKYITKEISEYVLYITLAQTQSSAVLTEDLAEAGGLLALNTEAVPAAAGYMTPDPDLISSTQPIPDHIVSTDRETDQNNELVIPPLDGSGQAARGLIDERSTTRDSRVN